jgi:hypothetical protein
MVPTGMISHVHEFEPREGWLVPNLAHIQAGWRSSLAKLAALVEAG